MGTFFIFFVFLVDLLFHRNLCAKRKKRLIRDCFFLDVGFIFVFGSKDQKRYMSLYNGMDREMDNKNSLFAVCVCMFFVNVNVVTCAILMLMYVILYNIGRWKWESDRNYLNMYSRYNSYIVYFVSDGFFGDLILYLLFYYIYMPHTTLLICNIKNCFGLSLLFKHIWWDFCWGYLSDLNFFL